MAYSGAIKFAAVLLVICWALPINSSSRIPVPKESIESQELLNKFGIDFSNLQKGAVSGGGPSKRAAPSGPDPKHHGLNPPAGKANEMH